MKNRGSTLLTILFFAGLLGLWAAEALKVPDRDARRLLDNRVLPDLFETRPDDLKRLEILGGTARLLFERRPEGGWQMLQPVDVAADPSMVESLAFNLKELTKHPEAGSLVSSDSGARGLDPPSRIVRLLGGASGGTVLAEIEIGSKFRDYRYVRAKGASSIEVVDAKQVETVDLDADRWRDQVLFRVPTFQAETLRIDRPEGTVRLDRSSGIWKMLEPWPAVGDDARIEGIIADLGALKVVDAPKGFAADDVKDLAPYGLDKPRVSIEVGAARGALKPRRLHVGAPVPNSPNDGRVRHFARRDDQDDVVVIDAKGLLGLGLQPNALRSQRVTDIEPGKVDFLKIGLGDREILLAKTSNGWGHAVGSNGGLGYPIDQQNVTDLIRNLGEIRTSVFLKDDEISDSGLKKSPMTISAWQPTAGATESFGTDAGGIPVEPKSPPRATLLVGKIDGVRKSIYVQVPGDPTVLAVPDLFAKVLPSRTMPFRDRLVARVVPSTIAKLSVVRGGKTYVVEPPLDPNDKVHWRMTRPTLAPADPEVLGRVLSALSNLRAETLITDRETSDVSEFGFASPSLSLTWSVRVEASPTEPAKKGTAEKLVETTLIVGGELASKPGERYAKFSDSPLVFTLPPELLQHFEAEWRDHTLLYFDPKQVDRVVARRPSSVVTFAPSPPGSSNWAIVDGGQGLDIDPSKIRPLVDALSRLVTPRYLQYDGPISADTGLNPPKASIEVHFGGPTRPQVLRLGGITSDGYLRATIAEGDAGAVAILPISGWEEWSRPANLATVPRVAPSPSKP